MRKILVITGLIVVLTLIVIMSMVKFVTEMREIENPVSHISRADDDFVLESSMNFGYPRSRARQKQNLQASERFPYMVAIIAHKEKGFFSCFGCFIQTEWVLTAAHCKRPDQSHRVVLYSDYAKNHTHTYPIVLWRVHEEFKPDAVDPKNDIAVAKIDLMGASYVVRRVAGLPKHELIKEVLIIVWKTVYNMDKTTYLTKDMDIYHPHLADLSKCHQTYGITLDISLICVDMSKYMSSFITEFGPMFADWPDRVVGLLTTKKPTTCHGKMAIFTNVTFHRDWILKTTKS